MIHRLNRIRFKVPLANCILVGIIFLVGYAAFGRPGKLNFNDYEDSVIIPKPSVGLLEPKETHKFWEKVFQVLSSTDVNIDNVAEAIQYLPKEDYIDGPATKEALLSRAKITDEVFIELRAKHEKILRELPTKIPTSNYKSGSKGIVMVGGGRYSWLSYLSILSLRETGSKLPVEVIIPTFEEFEKELEFCSKILPPLNASCVPIADVLGPAVMLRWQHKIKSYQFKSLALMSSSFQHMLLLDSDNMLLQNPDRVFDSDLYKSNGMVTWPDYWTRTVSPKYYDIAGIDVNELKRARYNRFPLKTPPSDEFNISEDELATVPFHDLEGAIPDLSTESGQLMINKATHGQTLMLSLYYNVYGPNLYYKLFSLGEQGEGDKDTFVAAAEVTRQKYYQLKSFILTIGYVDSDGGFQGVAMGQKDPLVDYELYQKNIVQEILSGDDKIETQIQKLKVVEKEKFDSHTDTPLFSMHCNFPKFDPLDLMGKDEIYDKENEKLKYRLYGDFKYRKGQGESVKEIDFELTQWNNINHALCEKKLRFTHFAKSNMDQLCTFIKNQVGYLSKT